MKRLIFPLLALFVINLLGSCDQKPQTPKPVSVIFDTDMAPDYDDVGALAMLHAMADNGETRILATLSSNMYVNAVPGIELNNIYVNRG